MAGDEGFEPPQTESESGVLPLHKSPKKASRRSASIIIQTKRKMSSVNFENAEKIKWNQMTQLARSGQRGPSGAAAAAMDGAGKGKALFFTNPSVE